MMELVAQKGTKNNSVSTHVPAAQLQKEPISVQVEEIPHLLPHPSPVEVTSALSWLFVPPRIPLYFQCTCMRAPKYRVFFYMVRLYIEGVLLYVSFNNLLFWSVELVKFIPVGTLQLWFIFPLELSEVLHISSSSLHLNLKPSSLLLYPILKL